MNTKIKRDSNYFSELLIRTASINQEILESYERAVPFNELYELRTFKASKSSKSENPTVEKALKHAGYFEKLKASCIPSERKLMPEKNETLQGMYIFWHNEKPVYIGISRNVFNRLKQHAFGKTHFEASLAYRMCKMQTTATIENRSALDFKLHQEELRNAFKVTVIPVECDYELYWLEVTLAGMLGTEHNEFKTH